MNTPPPASESVKSGASGPSIGGGGAILVVVVAGSVVVALAVVVVAAGAVVVTVEWYDSIGKRHYVSDGKGNGHFETLEGRGKVRWELDSLPPAEPEEESEADKAPPAPPVAPPRQRRQSPRYWHAPPPKDTSDDCPICLELLAGPPGDAPNDAPEPPGACAATAP